MSDTTETTLPELPEPTNLGACVDQEIERELADSYLTYAMSTIVDRALPDVRDGLKPSQRRILVAMGDLNLTPGRKHSKCAGIVGETMKRYHPHGDGAIYPTLVNMAQEWKTRALLVDKQGNFGSIDPDPPAAMRYTEARLHPHAMELLADLKLDTVDWQPNFDEQYLEPKVLPARLPNLLINGSTGIAVGMASSMPPHNLVEVCNAIIATIERPEITLNELMEIIPGPDFPTGGILCGRAGVHAAYSTGRGRAVVRARIEHEERGTRNLLVVKEIPYQVSKNDSIVQKIVQMRKDGKLEDVANIVDESSNRAGMRVVIELKRNADPHVVETQLYQLTPLQSSFSIINIALVKGQPRTLSLREMMDYWVDHRIEVIRRRTEFLLHKARTEAHRIEGLIYAVCDIDEVIAMIRASRTRDEAIDKLQARSFQIADDSPHASSIPQRLKAESAENPIHLTRVQAEAIGRLQLIQLVGLEIESLVANYTKLITEIEDLEGILASQERVLTIITDDLITLRDEFGRDKWRGARRTEISDIELGNVDMGDLIPRHTVAITLSREGYIKRLPVDEYRLQNRGGKGIIGARTNEDDAPLHVVACNSHDDLLCFTQTGRVFILKAYEIPEGSRTSKGRATINVLALQENEKICAMLPVDDFEAGEDYLTFATRKGTVKRTALKEYRNINRSGLRAINLREDDDLVSVLRTHGAQHLLLATQQGMAIRFDENNSRLMGRVASGVRGISLADNDNVIGAVAVDPSDEGMLLTLTQNGYGKQTATTQYLVHSEDGSTRVQGRGGKGRRDMRVTDKNGPVMAVRLIEETDQLLLMSENGQMIRIATDTIRQTKRDSQGVRVMNMNEGDSLVAVAQIPAVEDDTEQDTEQNAIPSTDNAN